MPNQSGRNMQNSYYRNTRRRCRRQNAGGTTVVTNRNECCTAPETIAEELYIGTPTKILVEDCYSCIDGCRQMEAQTRCLYWPKFAHPRWLSCRQLHNL